MKFKQYLSIKNLRKKPARTAALILIAAFLAFSVFAGSMVVSSLQNGIKSYEARLGADIVVVPSEANLKSKLDSILLQGIPGAFYMDSSVLDKVLATDGVEAASPQFYLASVSASCCSVAVQIIGFDPETDFSVQPWIREYYSGDIADLDIIVGSDITMPTNGYIRFFNVDCHVVAQLGKTGTGLDTAVYCNMDTIRYLMQSARDIGMSTETKADVNKVISTVMVRTADGCDTQRVAASMNAHIRKVKATSTKDMISGIAGGLSNISKIIGSLVAVIWVLALVIMIVAFVMISNERTKEFAILRTIGASRGMLSGLIRMESVIISLIGAVIGIIAGCVVVFPFSASIGKQLDMPYLLPGTGKMLLAAAGAIVLALIAGVITSIYSAHRITKNETGLILREGA